MMVMNISLNPFYLGDLMQDLKTGQLLGASPKAQFYGQMIGSLASAFIASGFNYLNIKACLYSLFFFFKKKKQVLIYFIDLFILFLGLNSPCQQHKFG